MSAPKVKPIRRLAIPVPENRADWPASMRRDFTNIVEKAFVEAGPRHRPRLTPRGCRCAVTAIREIDTAGQALTLLEDAFADLELAAGFLFKVGTTKEHRRLMHWLARFAHVAEHASTGFREHDIPAQVRIAERLAAIVKPLERARKKELGPHAPSYGWSVVHPRSVR